MTALPIVETQAGDISAYVPTNVISITDGQIYLESTLFNAGVRPALNVGLSVSRVGGSAQSRAMKKVSGRLRLYLSQYRELSSFAQFGSELDNSTVQMIETGKRIVEVLKQSKHSAYDSVHEVIILYIVMKDLLQEVPTDKVNDFVKAFCSFLDINCVDIVCEINEKNDIGLEIGLVIEERVKEFSKFYFEEIVNE